MASHDPNETARWGRAVEEAMGKYRQNTDKALAEMASRGFMSPPGVLLEIMVEEGLEAKKGLVKANAEIYKVRREMLAKDNETEQKYVLKLLKLEAEAYRAGLENAYRLEEAQASASLDEYRAKIERLNAETDKRQVRLITMKADVERQVNYWKKLQIIAEKQNLEGESQLIAERVRTAEIKLSTLDLLALIVQAEQLVLAAERKKAEALRRVVDASRQVAEIKKTMIPLYKEKAAARMQQAEAITREAEDKKELELLGYEKVEVIRTRHAAEHDEKLAEALYEQTRLEFVRADRLTALYRAQASRLLNEYENYIRNLVISVQERTGLLKAALGAHASYIRTMLDAQGDIASITAAAAGELAEGGAKANAALSVGAAHVAQITASATRSTRHIVERYMDIYTSGK
ncbi:MAG: hypothetical protein AB1491_00055 [Thermodesulfobacteriota bacterium]